LPVGRRSRVVAVLHKIDVTRLPMRAVPPADLGQFLGGLHRILRGCPTAGAWTPDEVLGHIRRGIMDAHPPSVRQMIEQAADGVGVYYDTPPPGQLLYGDGPEIFSPDGTDISAIIDWGGVRVGSVADDIGCWTAHGATDQLPLPDYTSAFLEGYGRGNDLTAESAAAVPLFQRLRIASRACYVTDPGPLDGIQAWMQQGFAM
jgi:Ser/Thr protein kinase RdoA (MazF antagonist)